MVWLRSSGDFSNIPKSPKGFPQFRVSLKAVIHSFSKLIQQIFSVGIPSEGQPDTGDVALEMTDKATPLI